jgi:hypothetical protein
MIGLNNLKLKKETLEVLRAINREFRCQIKEYSSTKSNAFENLFIENVSLEEIDTAIASFISSVNSCLENKHLLTGGDIFLNLSNELKILQKKDYYEECACEDEETADCDLFSCNK